MVPRQHRSIASVKEQEQGIVELSTVPSSPFSRHVFLRRGSQFLVMGIPVVLLLLFVLYPLAAIILQSIFPQLYAANPSLMPSLDALKQVTVSHETIYRFIYAQIARTKNYSWRNYLPRR